MTQIQTNLLLGEEIVNHPSFQFLSPKEARILVARKVEHLTLEAVGKEMGFTRERVRQIEAKALAKLEFNYKPSLLEETVHSEVYTPKPENLLQETKDLLKVGKELIARVAFNLLALKESGEWEQYGHSTFPKFCEMELELSQGNTSKYLAIAAFYAPVYKAEEIGAVDTEKLYLAAKLGIEPGEALSRAKTWSRDDFKQEKVEAEPHEGKWVTYCDICKLSKDRHP